MDAEALPGWLFAVINVLHITMSAVIVFLIVREVAGERPTALAESCPFDHVVVLADRTFTGAFGYTPVFENRTFRVYRHGRAAL